MIPSKMPIGRPTFEKWEQCAHRSIAIKATAKNVRAVINKRLMMEFKHLMISEPKLLVGGHQVEFGVELQVTGLKVNRRKPGL